MCIRWETVGINQIISTDTSQLFVVKVKSCDVCEYTPSLCFRNLDIDPPSKSYFPAAFYIKTLHILTISIHRLYPRSKSRFIPLFHFLATALKWLSNAWTIDLSSNFKQDKNTALWPYGTAAVVCGLLLSSQAITIGPDFHRLPKSCGMKLCASAINLHVELTCR